MQLRTLSPTIDVPSVLHVVRASCISPASRNVVAMFTDEELAQEWIDWHQRDWAQKHRPGSLWIEAVEIVDGASK